MPITINGNGAISGLGDIDGHDLETATLVVSGDTTIAPQAVGRATLFVDDSANSVGINTTTPASAVFLEVADATDPIVSLNNTSNGEVRIGCTSSLGYVGTNSNHPLNLRANNTNYLKVDTNGNIGLGSLSTNYTLDVTKNFTGDNAVAIFNNISSGSAAKASLKVGYDSTAHLEIYRLGSAAPIYYDTKQSLSSHNFQVAGNGVFAITNALPISATSNSNRYGVFNTTNAGNGYIGFQGQGTSYLDIGHNDQLYGTDAGEGDGGGINSRPGYTLSLGSGNNCKVYFPGNSSAALKLTSNCEGIDFSDISSTGGGTVSSNTLDDYEEGIFTTTITDSLGGSLSVSPSNDKLQYVKIGNMVFVSGRPLIDGTGGTGYARISLPFTNANLTQAADRAAGSVDVRLCNSSYDIGLFNLQLNENSNYVTLTYGGSNDSQPSTPALANGTQIWISIFYRTV